MLLFLLCLRTPAYVCLRTLLERSQAMASAQELLAVLPLHMLTGLHEAAVGFVENIERVSHPAGLHHGESVLIQSYHALVVMVFDVIQVRASLLLATELK